MGIDWNRLLKRGVAEIISEQSLRQRLTSGRPLRLKQGFDPSRPQMHLGNAVGPRKLRQFQELGHQVVLVVGDWTAQIGDPSGRDETRPRLSPQQVKQNARTYQEQFGKIVDLSRTEIRWQSEWYGDFDLEKVFDLASRFTLAQVMAHETFRKRYDQGLPLTLLELQYPLLQAYDSVAIQADVEFGGMDQKFNNLMGRELQASLGLPPQEVFLVPLIPGSDGQKMGKSFGNTIDILAPPEDMYGKIMSMADEVMPIYFETLTDVPDEEIPRMQRDMRAGRLNPRDAKMRLAREIVGQFHSPEAAARAEEEFVRVFQEGEPPSEIPSFPVLTSLDDVRDVNIVLLLVQSKMAKSQSEARRLLLERGIEVDGKTVSQPWVTVRAGSIVKVGKRRWVRIVPAE